tara:strand:+ start:87876 stop:89225 length:1350 start_codon:yes stop_codon:yes gene_type:complete
MPAGGTLNLEPDTPIFVEFFTPVETVPEGAIVVGDGGGPLPGTLSRIGDGTVWRWTGARELSRGAHLNVQVATNAGESVVAWLVVREAIHKTVIEIPDVVVTGVTTWPGGRRVVTCDLRSFEIVNGAAIERVLQMPRTGSPLTYGDDGYIYAIYGAAGGTLVRGTLGGGTESIPMPTGANRISINGNGDVVAYIGGANTQPEEQGITRLGAGQSTWELPGPIAHPAGHPRIDGAGNVMMAVIENDQPRLLRFPVGSVTPEIYSVAPPMMATQASFDVSDDGIGLLVWLGSQGLRAARFVPGTGLELLPGSTSISNSGASGSPQLSTVTSTSGSTRVAIGHYYWGVGVIERYMRIERDGWFGPFAGSSGPGLPITLPSPERGEWWLAGEAGGQIWMSRSRPGSGNDPLRIVYTQSTSNSLLSFHYSVDDSGRILLAVNETLNLLRIVVLE